MKIKLFLSSILLVVFAGLILTGCHKVATTPDIDITAAEDETNASFTANDTKNIVDVSVQGQSSYSPLLHRNFHGIAAVSHCAKVHGNDTLVVVNGNTINDTVVYIEFGLSNCLCSDGRNRRGTIIVYWPIVSGTFRQSYFDSANVINIVFSNYYINDNGISGALNWAYEGINEYGYENWNIQSNLIVTYSDGQTALWNSQRNNVLMQVDSTFYYEVTGNASGRARNGVDYTLAITKPLYFTAFPVWLGGCSWVESGVVSISRSSSVNILTVTYGNIGTCMATAKASINSNNYTFSMW